MFGISVINSEIYVFRSPSEDEFPEKTGKHCHQACLRPHALASQGNSSNCHRPSLMLMELGQCNQRMPRLGIITCADLQCSPEMSARHPAFFAPPSQPLARITDCRSRLIPRALLRPCPISGADTASRRSPVNPPRSLSVKCCHPGQANPEPPPLTTTDEATRGCT